MGANQCLIRTNMSLNDIPPPPRHNDPSIPTVYDPQWQFYVDLTPDQIAAFQSMPEWAIYCATQPLINYGNDPAATATALTEMMTKSWAVTAWGQSALQAAQTVAQTAAQTVVVTPSSV